LFILRSAKRNEKRLEDIKRITRGQSKDENSRQQQRNRLHPATNTAADY